MNVTYRCGHRKDGNGCLLGVAAVVDGALTFAAADGVMQPVRGDRHSRPVADGDLVTVRCKHLSADLHPSVVRNDVTGGRRVVIVRTTD